MIWDLMTDAAQRVDYARQKLFEDRNAQFWGTLGLTMPFVPEPGLNTFATDAVSIFYDPEYVMTLSLDQCKGVIAHEISHPALDHFRRQGMRDTKTWNISTDYELNADLVKAGLTLPEGSLFDPRFDGLSAEQIFNVVSRENAEAERQGQPAPHQPGSGDMRMPVNAETGNPMSGDELSELADQWEMKTAQALGAARKAGLMAGGHIPTHLVAVTEHVNAPSVMDWRQPLRAFIDRLGSRQSSWAKLSRRGLSRGQVLPGQKVIRPSRVCWAIDVSGSMDKAKNRQALNEAQAALDDGACDAIDVWYIDTATRGVFSYEAGETIELRDATGGGTAFANSMAEIADSDETYACIVFVTDGQTSSWGTDPEIPTLWAITGTVPETERLKPPFGEKLCLYTA